MGVGVGGALPDFYLFFPQFSRPRAGLLGKKVGGFWVDNQYADREK